MGFSHTVVLVPHEPALGEYQGPFAERYVAEQSTDHLLRVSQPIDGGGIDPVYAQVQRVPHGGERGGIILWSPTIGPAAPAYGPGAEPYGRYPEPARAERASGQRVLHGSLQWSAWVRTSAATLFSRR